MPNSMTSVLMLAAENSIYCFLSSVCSEKVLGGKHVLSCQTFSFAAQTLFHDINKIPAVITNAWDSTFRYYRFDKLFFSVMDTGGG